MLKGSKFFILIGITTIFHAMNVMASEEREVSIYNIENGTLIFSYEEGADEYVSANYAYKLYTDNTRANWQVNYFDDGSIQLENVKRDNLCLSYYGDGYQVTQETCDKLDTASTKQKFNLVPTRRGAVLLLVKADEKEFCLYTYAGNSYFYVYSDDCPGAGSIDSKWLWALVPSLNGSERFGG